MYRLFKFISVLILIAVIVSACSPAATPPPAPPAPAAPPAQAPTTAPAVNATVAPSPMPTADRSNPKDVILATTTSTRDSGLLDVLLPLFEKKSGFTVKMIAVGSGQAMAMGQQGNADVLLVHAPASEKTFMDKGFGKDRLLVMHNDFVVVGPSEDPAKIKSMTSVVDAFKKLVDAKATFVTRADNSGTNQAELAIWKKAGVTPKKEDAWYLQTGQGMGDTLRITSEKSAYTLSDRATYLAQKATLKLDVLVEGDSSLLNVYHVITVSPEKFPMVNKDAAKAFADFMVDSDTQKEIGKFGLEKFGQQLFFPDAGKSDKDLGL